MWSTIIGAVVGAGAGYAAHAYSRTAQDACFTANYKEIPVRPDASADEKVAAAQQNLANIDPVSGECAAGSPIKAFLSDHMYTPIAGMLVLGAIAGYFVGRK